LSHCVHPPWYYVDFGRFSLYLRDEHLALFNFSIYTIIQT
jgi:hypothetical protein